MGGDVSTDQQVATTHIEAFQYGYGPFGPVQDYLYLQFLPGG